MIIKLAASKIDSAIATGPVTAAYGHLTKDKKDMHHGKAMLLGGAAGGAAGAGLAHIVGKAIRETYKGKKGGAPAALHSILKHKGKTALITAAALGSLGAGMGTLQNSHVRTARAIARDNK